MNLKFYCFVCRKTFQGISIFKKGAQFHGILLSKDEESPKLRDITKKLFKL